METSNIYCPHHNLKADILCCAHNCNNRLLCKFCPHYKNTHHIDHFVKISKLQEPTFINAISKMAEKKIMLEERAKDIVEGIYKDMQKFMKTFLKEMKTTLQDKVEKLLNSTFISSTLELKNFGKSKGVNLNNIDVIAESYAYLQAWQQKEVKNIQDFVLNMESYNDIKEKVMSQIQKIPLSIKTANSINFKGIHEIGMQKTNGKYIDGKAFDIIAQSNVLITKSELEDEKTAIELWDMDNFKKISGNIITMSICAIKYAPKLHSLIATSQASKGVQVFKIGNSNISISKVYKRHKGDHNFIKGLEYFEDLGLVLSGGKDGMLRIWNIFDCSDFAVIDMKSGIEVIKALEFGQFALGLTNGNMSIIEFNNGMKKFEEKFLNRIHDGAIEDIDYEGVGKFIITASIDNTCKILKNMGEKLSVVSIFSKEGAKFTSISMFPLQNVVATAYSNKKLLFWDCESERKITEISQDHKINTIISMKQKRIIVTGNSKGELYFYRY